jgi:hypothetical protein
MVVLAHLQGAAATFRVGRHHHRGSLQEGRGLTHALTHIAPTDLTVAAALVRKACSKRRRSRLWSKPVNLRTCGLVSDSIPIVQAFAELRYGAVVHTREKQCEIWAQFRPNPVYNESRFRVSPGRVARGRCGNHKETCKRERSTQHSSSSTSTRARSTWRAAAGRLLRGRAAG